jgi:hypothetical protein
VERDAAVADACRSSGLGDTHAYLKGAALNLKPGDALLSRRTDVLPEHWDLRVARRRRADAATSGRSSTWDEPLGSATWRTRRPPQPFALRKRIDVFGHNAPLEEPITDPATDDWTFALCPRRGHYVDLRLAPRRHRRSWVVLSSRLPRAVEGQERHGALAAQFASREGHAARARGGENYDCSTTGARDDGLRRPGTLELAERPDYETSGRPSTSTSTCRRCAEAGRCSFADDDGGGSTRTVVVDGCSRRGAGGELAGTSPRVQRGRDRHGNVALATHGETVQQLLGSGARARRSSASRSRTSR